MKSKNNYITLSIYIALILILILCHENWRDEAQAWLIVKNLNFFEMIGQLRIEGHPFLWYIILYPFAKLCFNYSIINCLSAFFVCLGVTLILFKTKLSIFEKIFISFSPALMYFFPIISRSYSLLPFLLFSIAILYNKKSKYSFAYNFLIFLLINTHLYVLPFALLLIIDEYYDLKKNFNIKKMCCDIIPLIAILLLFIQLFGCVDKNGEVTILMISKTFLWKTFVISLFYVVSVFMIKKRNLQNILKKITIIFLSIIGLYFVESITGLNSPQKDLISVLYLICLILMIDDKYLKSILYVMIVTLSFIYYPYIYEDVRYNYSSSKEIANYINKNIDKNSVFVGIYDYTASSIIPYTLNYKYYNIYEHNYNQFISWTKKRYNNKIAFFDSKNQCDIISDSVSLKRYYVIVDSFNYNNIKCPNWQLIYKTKKSIIIDENYKLYLVRK